MLAWPLRRYINLETGEYQPIHPLLKQFREHLTDRMENEFLWDYRGFLKIRCSECGHGGPGLADSVLGNGVSLTKSTP